MNTLVINLTRFGDLLQSQPVFTELAQDGRRTALVVLENFSAASGLLRHADQVFALPGASLLRAVDTDWRKALVGFQAFAAGIRERFSPDRVINLTPSVAARVLARHLAQGEVSGFGLDEEGFGRNSSAWASFLEISSANRGVSPFNIVDLFRRAAGGGRQAADSDLRPAADVDRAAAGHRLQRAAPEGARGFVGFQLGASQDARRWPVEYFARLGEAVWEERRLTPVLLGSKGEKGLAQRYLAVCRAPAVNLCGETSLTELAAVTTCLKALCTNDTGTMHLAAGLGTPVMAFFLATAQPFDTGPYRAGSASLEPDMPCHPCSFGADCPFDRACRRSIRPETARETLFSFLDDGVFRVGDHAGSRVWESYVDGRGFMDLRSLSGHEHDDRTSWLTLLRDMFRQFLDEETVSDQGPPLALSPQAARDIHEVCRDSAGLLRLLAGQAQVLASLRQPGIKDKFMATWRRLHALWNGNPRFQAVGHLWMHLSQAPGVDVTVLGRIIERFASLTAAMERRAASVDGRAGTGIE
jgi:ADP-heptose:LPS heptosyltransferase